MDLPSLPGKKSTPLSSRWRISPPHSTCLSVMARVGRIISSSRLEAEKRIENTRNIVQFLQLVLKLKVIHGVISHCMYSHPDVVAYRLIE